VTGFDLAATSDDVDSTTRRRTTDKPMTSKRNEIIIVQPYIDLVPVDTRRQAAVSEQEKYFPGNE
jgi:hypothetical protein